MVYHIEKKFKIFEEGQARKWATENYKNINVDDNVEKVIAKYCKEDEPEVNFALRNNKFNSEVINEIKILDEFLKGQYLNENIVVFRLLNFNPFEKDKIFIDKGFMSTSLVKKNINLNRDNNFRMKIYLPIGTKGFYVNFISCREDEQEFLLHRETVIQCVDEYLDSDGKIELKCYYVPPIYK